MSPSREICKICFHANPVGFAVPDQLWRSIVPVQFQASVICITCFARIADEQLAAWDEAIELYPVSLATHIGRSPVGG